MVIGKDIPVLAGVLFAEMIDFQNTRLSAALAVLADRAGAGLLSAHRSFSAGASATSRAVAGPAGAGCADARAQSC